MKKVKIEKTMYKLSDGRLVETEKEAVYLQKQLDLDSDLNRLIMDDRYLEAGEHEHFKEHRYLLISFITNYQHELCDILNGCLETFVDYE